MSPPKPAVVAKLCDGALSAVAGLHRASVIAASQAAPKLRRAQEAAAAAAADGARRIRSLSVSSQVGDEPPAASAPACAELFALPASAEPAAEQELSALECEPAESAVPAEPSEPPEPIQPQPSERKLADPVGQDHGIEREEHGHDKPPPGEGEKTN